mmetsp:Transcript_11359/g.21632  ORF Transcript_11359/g.21632 Transcript_11359/m.21632 type:complete len:346 (-) Transcript_11359:269-1306(-)
MTLTTATNKENAAPRDAVRGLKPPSVIGVRKAHSKAAAPSGNRFGFKGTSLKSKKSSAVPDRKFGTAIVNTVSKDTVPAATVAAATNAEVEQPGAVTAAAAATRAEDVDELENLADLDEIDVLLDGSPDAPTVGEGEAEVITTPAKQHRLSLSGSGGKTFVFRSPFKNEDGTINEFEIGEQEDQKEQEHQECSKAVTDFVAALVAPVAADTDTAPDANVSPVPSAEPEAAATQQETAEQPEQTAAQEHQQLPAALLSPAKQDEVKACPPAAMSPTSKLRGKVVLMKERASELQLQKEKYFAQIEQLYRLCYPHLPPPEEREAKEEKEITPEAQFAGKMWKVLSSR